MLASRSQGLSGVYKPHTRASNFISPLFSTIHPQPPHIKSNMFASVYIAVAFIATFAHGLTIDITSRQVAATNASSVSTQIHPYGVVGKCLNVRGDVMANGTPVEL